MSKTKITAIIVAYHPDLALLQRVIEQTAAMVSEIVVVNNDRGDWASSLPPSAVVHLPAKNLGLAAAYNFGLDHARRSGSSHVLLLDQDSVPRPRMVEHLLEGHGRHIRIAATGPLWQDARSGELGKFVVRFGSPRTPGPGEVLKVQFLISSGSLIALDAAAEIGPFDNNLFIEHVDTDWALRAEARGFALYGVADAVLEHRIGDAVLSLPWSQQRAYLNSPERTYYLVRNSLRLWRRPYATWRWRLFDFRRLLKLLVLYLVFMPGRAERTKMAFRGVLDARRLDIAEIPGPFSVTQTQD